MKLSITAFILSLLFPIPFAPLIGVLFAIMDLTREDTHHALNISTMLIGSIVSMIQFVNFFMSLAIV